MKHTKGKWTYFRDADSADIIAVNDGCHVACVEPINGYDPQAEQDANGALLAAAPELLEALRDAYDFIKQLRDATDDEVSDLLTNDMAEDIEDAALVAIARASGPAFPSN